MGCVGSKEMRKQSGANGYPTTITATTGTTQSQSQSYLHQEQPQQQQYYPPVHTQKAPARRAPGKPAVSVTAGAAASGTKQDNTILGKPYEDVRRFYTLGKELGRGQFGITYLCTENSTGHSYACKSILKRKLVSKSDRDDIKRVIQIMQHLSGQLNIVEFKGAYEDRYSVHLVMELCAGGELFDRIIATGHYRERATAAPL